MFSSNRNKRCIATRQLHSRNNSNTSLNYRHLATRTPLERTSTTCIDKSLTQILTDHKNQRNIDLYLPLCKLNKNNFSSITNLITTETLHNVHNVTVEDLTRNEFPVLKYSIQSLVEFSKTMLETSQFCRINFPGKIVRKIVNLIADNYHSVAYHNFSHAFSLMLVSLSLSSSTSSVSSNPSGSNTSTQNNSIFTSWWQD